MDNLFVVNAAGGNATAIEVVPRPLARKDYESRGVDLLNRFPDLAVEQSGFLVLEGSHFEMAGGEFCGNAARSSALLLSRFQSSPEVEFTMSGFSGKVYAEVKEMDKANPVVTCLFPDYQMKVAEKTWKNQDVSVVDLGGIVHVIIEGKFPDDYEEELRAIIDSFGFSERSAVGAVWINRTNQEEAKMDPVVWVNSIDTFFYETSCGSGSIAVAKATGSKKMIQPSGEAIYVEFDGEDCRLKSEMEVIYGSFNANPAS